MTASVTAGNWYLTVRCECGAWIVFDKSQGPADAVALPQDLHLTCEACGTSSSFELKHVRHSRAARSEPGKVASP